MRWYAVLVGLVSAVPLAAQTTPQKEAVSWPPLRFAQQTFSRTHPVPGGYLGVCRSWSVTLTSSRLTVRARWNVMGETTNRRAVSRPWHREKLTSNFAPAPWDLRARYKMVTNLRSAGDAIGSTPLSWKQWDLAGFTYKEFEPIEYFVYSEGESKGGLAPPRRVWHEPQPPDRVSGRRVKPLPDASTGRDVEVPLYFPLILLPVRPHCWQFTHAPLLQRIKAAIPASVRAQPVN